MKFRQISTPLAYVRCCIGAFLFICCGPPPPEQFTQLTPAETGLDFRNDIVESQYNNILTYEYTYNGAGIAAGDINNDGLSDLYFSGNSVPNKLFINKGNWRFEDVTTASGTAGRKDWKTGVTMVDINGDGWLDMYVCYSGNAPGEGYNLPVVRDYPNRANQLFINNGCDPGGTPTFSEQASTYGLDAIGTFSSQAYFLDYDLDGDLDMFLLNHANMFYSAFLNTKRLRNLRHPYFGNKLYRNDRTIVTEGPPEGRFSEVSKESGFHGSGLNFGLSAAISDLNFDHWPDIYVTNDFEEQDFCYINSRDGTFREVSHQLFGHLSKFSMGSDIADVNNDGLPDILVLDMLPEDNHRQKLLKGPDEYDRYTLAVDSGYHHQYMRNTLQLNRGFGPDSLPRFSEIGQLAGISNTDWSWSPFFVDLDNDGLKEIFVTNGYLRDYTNLDFMKYTSTVYAEASSAGKSIDYLNIIQQLPVTRLNNYVFKNEDGIHFTNTTGPWGLHRKSVSNGAVYADLDNDGDYDLVTNNLNDQAGVLRNNQEVIQRNHFIKIKLIGKGANTQALGARVMISIPGVNIFHEAYFTRGYASSVEPVLTIGIGSSPVVKRIQVQWPDGTQSIITDALPNQTLVIEQGNAQQLSNEMTAVPDKTILKDVTNDSGLDFTHHENTFIDFKMHRLLYYQLSRLGGKLAAGDVNHDGNDDVFFGGASGQAGELFLGTNNGRFRKEGVQPWENDATSEDMGSAFFDADKDGDMDIYVVSGGNEFPPGSSFYQDRLYLNDGSGRFIKAIGALPVETTSGSCVVATDYDQDGDQDLFVGGRHSPSNYGIIPRSFVLQNNSVGGNIEFSDVTSNLNEDLQNPGMVTDALWTDFNNDSWPDLIIVGEWMTVRVFENRKGMLFERSDLATLEKSNGWWSRIFPADIDGDGDTDYFLGNAGTNLQFKASPERPIQLFSGDFNKDGVPDPILCHYIQGTSYPLASRDELLEQVSTLRKKFVKYADYADATIQDVADEEQLEKSYKFNAFILQSCWMENLQGKELKLHLLPEQAQLSSVNGFLHEDFDSDGSKELLVAGNFFPFKPQLGRSDASAGTLLKFEGGVLRSVSNGAGIWLTGDIRDMALLKFNNGTNRVLVSRNNNEASVYAFVNE